MSSEVVTLKRKFSQSLITTWMACPLQARFQEVDTLPRRQNAAASFGTCVHYALEIYEKSHGDIDRAVGTFKDVWANPEKLGVTPDVYPARQTYGGYMQRGLDMLREYHERLKWETRKVIATEHKFCVPFGDYALSGIVDLLEVKKDSKGREQLRLVDFKTSAKAPYMSELRLNVQFSVYSYASYQPEFWLGFGSDPRYRPMENGEWWYEQLKDMPRRHIWYGLMQSKEYDAGARDDNDWMRLYRVCKEIDKAMDAGIYVPNISGSSCTWCDYIEPCRLPINPRSYDPSDE